jgi:hypothetical protein
MIKLESVVVFEHDFHNSMLDKSYTIDVRNYQLTLIRTLQSGFLFTYSYNGSEIRVHIWLGKSIYAYFKAPKT